MYIKVEGPRFSDEGGPTLVGPDALEFFLDFDALDWLKPHSLNSDFRNLSINEMTKYYFLFHT